MVKIIYRDTKGDCPNIVCFDVEFEDGVEVETDNQELIDRCRQSSFFEVVETKASRKSK